jgi:hypothetical protein
VQKDIKSIKCELLPYLIEHQCSSTPVPGQPVLEEEEEDDHPIISPSDSKRDEARVAAVPATASVFLMCSLCCRYLSVWHAWWWMGYC